MPLIDASEKLKEGKGGGLVFHVGKKLNGITKHSLKLAKVFSK